MPGSPADGIPLYYWDSCVLLSFVNAIEGRVATLDAMLQAAQGKTIRIFASTLSIAEVAFAQSEQLHRALDEGEELALDSLWLDGVIMPVEVDVVVARDARSLMREVMPLGWRLRAPDAIHLATARRLNVTECHTYDSGLLKYSEWIGCRVCEPSFSVHHLRPGADF